MGYSVYVTRRKDWSDGSGPSISEEEWLRAAGSDARLASLRWNGGNVEAKNADLELVRKMVAVASAIGATVQGDDGETYDLAGKPLARHKSHALSGAFSWLRETLTFGRMPVAPPPFDVGERVRDVWGNFGRVTEVDARAEHGFGRITVKYDDGRISYSYFEGHGFERADA